jgi:mRNA interferase RelE/StbE
MFKKLEWLAKNANTYDHYALKGELSGYFRLRVGNYRVIYTIDHTGRIIIVEVVGHRREIYDE